ncbi:ParB N-terminal domain-containing protein [Massilia suwonensis]|uniref:ParB N-terminal domain-containing protein n=1 Tax=Massilia suwonensis TaxID=648895 RepID=A0ABW0MFH8_9BURK
MNPTDTNSLVRSKVIIEGRIKAGSPPPAIPNSLPLESIEIIPQVFQHREDAQWASDDHVQTLVKVIKNSTKAAKKKPLEPLTVFWIGDGWALIDGHHRYKAYKAIGYADPVPVTVFSGTLDEAIGQALKGNSKDKLAMSKSEKTNAAWRLVISTGLSLNQLVDASTISKPTIIQMRNVMRTLKETDPGLDLDELTWHQALRKYQGKEEEDFEPDFEWRDKRIAKVAQKLSDTFGKEFKRKPELFWEAVRKYDSNLTDHFLKMHNVDPEDFSWSKADPNEF